MSGPKGVRVSVVSAAELRRRDDEARSARCDQLVLELAGLAAQLRFIGRSRPVDVEAPADRTHDALIEWEQSLRSAITDARTKVRVEAAREVARRVAVAERAGQELDTSGVRLGGPRSVNLHALVAMIADLRDDARRGDLADEAARLLENQGGEASPRNLIAFRRKVESAIEVQGLRDLAVDAVLDVAHIATPEADRIRSRAAAVSTAEDLSAVQTAVTVLQDAATTASDAAFIEGALHDVLTELGFTIGEGFQLEDRGRSVAVGVHPEHSGYGVRVQVNPQNAMLYTRLVAEGDTTPEADAQSEEESCAKVLAIAERLEGHGVAAELVFERQPGEVPVERRSTPSTGSRRRRPRRSSAGGARTA